MNAAQRGDTISIQAGAYSEQITITGKNNVAGASEADRIVIEADPLSASGSIVLKGAVQQCTKGFAIQLQQSKFITLRGLTITGAGGQAISLMGGNNQNTAIHIERNRLFGNGSSECDGGITIARGNPDTLIVNNVIYNNGRDGIHFIDADGGPHSLVNNTIHANRWNGIEVARNHNVLLVNNAITQNGTAGGSTGGRFGVKLEGSNSPVPQGIELLSNLICGNRLGEINGPVLDSTDAANLTPTGTEGPGVSASPGCAVPGTVYQGLNGLDGLANTADDDFTLAATSPAIDHGMDPRTLGLPILLNPLFEADFSTEAVRPQDGNASGTAEFDLGAVEKSAQCTPGKTEECYDGPAGTKGIGLCKAGTKTCQPEGTFGSCEGQVLPAAEIPGNGSDEDCDGLTPQCTPGTNAECYDGPPGTKNVGICKAGIKTCNPDGTFGACQGQVLPAPEIPGNNIDENCDGLTPQCTPGSSEECYDGPPGTKGVGQCKAGTRTCKTDGTFGTCQGQVLPAPEIPGNGSNEDCNGSDGQTQGAFSLSAAPATAEVIQGQSVSYVLMVNGTALTQLATLGLSGLPAGVTGSFNSQHVAAGQTSLLTIETPSSQPPGSVSLAVSASAFVNGTDVTQSTPLTLNILPVTTSFVGRTVVADALRTPLAGVSISLLGLDGTGKTTGCTVTPTVSDAAGNFMFTSLPPECTGGQLIRYDGTTATSPFGKYAGVDLFYNIVANQVTTSPVLIHLPRIDNQETICVQQDAPQDQTFAFQTIPDLSVTVYAHTTFTPNPQYPPPAGKCPVGQFPLIGIDVPVDRLPDEMPPDTQNVMPFIVAFQPPNAVASQQVAVSFPNLLNTPPGTNMALMTLDPTKGVMVNYGRGTVSNDGTQIIPDLDSTHPGLRFGLVHFDWHGPLTPLPPEPGPCPSGSCCPVSGGSGGAGGSGGVGGPIDPASGIPVLQGGA